MHETFAIFTLTAIVILACSIGYIYWIFEDKHERLVKQIFKWENHIEMQFREVKKQCRPQQG